MPGVCHKVNMKRCDGYPRRDFVRVGGLTALGVTIGSLSSSRRLIASEPAAPARAKRCILVWLDGGPSHLETFDPKPDAPAEVRGPLGSIATSIAGVRVGECLPRTSQLMDKLAIVRSMTSPLGEHNFGTHYMLTGYKPTPALEYPAYGATLAAVHQSIPDSPASDSSAVLPPNIAVPAFSRNLSGNGFLPASMKPFAVGGNPGRPDFKVQDLDFFPGLDLDRLNRRRQVVDAMNRFAALGDADDQRFNDPDLQRAYALIESADAKAAFDLSKEPDSVRARYGQGGNPIGQSCLLARRLVERGVPFVTVTNGGWDTHQNIFQLKERFPGDQNGPVASLDRAVSALISDLDQRGMLDETLVVVMGEFGRTPKINPAGGRDHWPNVFSVMLAGGGVRGGQVIGSSDRLGEFPADRPVTPSDLAATIYQLLGIEADYELSTRDGRPVRVVPDGAAVVSELIA